MSELINVLEDIVEDDEDLRDLFTDLQAQTDALEAYVIKLGAEARNDSVSLILKLVRDHTRYIKEHRGQGTLRSLDAMKRFRRIEVLMRRLQDDVELRTWDNTVKQLEETRLSRLSPVYDARYNSSYATTIQRGACTPGTRQELQTILQAWAQPEEIRSNNEQSGGPQFVERNGAQVFWMNGMAGTGKTTLAYSLCDWLEANTQLGASFFCSRTSSLCQSIDRIIPTIAYQLGRFSPAYRSALCKALGDDPDAATREVQGQFERLILEPIKSIRSALPNGVVVVIDALDECRDNYGAETILELLLKYAANLPIKFFLTSRPEPLIRGRMLSSNGSLSSTIHLHDVESSIIEDDIKVYLTDVLKRVSPRPTESQFCQLAKQSGKLFIYAATLARYICPRRVRVDSNSRLQTILAMNQRYPNSGVEPSVKLYEELDLLYGKVLELAFHEDLDRHELEFMQNVLRTVVCAKEPLDIETLAALLGYTREQVLYSLEPLYSVLHVPEGGGLISTLHASFPDFLLDRSRVGQAYYCDQTQQNGVLARGCFEVMKQQLRFNICDLESSFITDADVPNFHKRVKESISPALFYACRFWGEHLRGSFGSAPGDFYGTLREFLSTQLLFWMEVMNLTGYIGIASSMLSQTRTWIQRNALWPDIWKELSDSQRFLMTFSTSPCSRATPHIYVSALSLCLRTSSVYKNYWKRTRRLIDTRQLAPFGQENSKLTSFSTSTSIVSFAFSHNGSCVYFAKLASPQIGTWLLYNNIEPFTSFNNQVPDNPINSVSTSSDGAHVVAITERERIQVYDAHSGNLLREFGIASGARRFQRIAISQTKPTYIASSHSKRTIRVWDLHSGEQIGPSLRGHKSRITAIAFSPTSTQLASGSQDNTIRLWDSVPDASISQVLVGHQSQINSVAFSPDGIHLVSGSSDRTIRLWDAYSGASLGQFFEGHTGAVTSVAFAPNCAQVVSGSVDKTVRLWDVQSRKELIRPIEEHNDSVSSVAFSPDGAYIASSSGSTVRLWDAQSDPRCKRSFEEQTDWNSALTPWGNASESYPALDELWDAHTNQKVDWYGYEHNSLPGIFPFQKSPPHKDTISTNLEFSAQSRRPGDSRNVTWKNQTITICRDSWHAAEIMTYQHGDQVLSVAFSSDCIRVVLGLYGMDRTAQVWEVGLPEAGPYSVDTTRSCLRCASDSENPCWIDEIVIGRSSHSSQWQHKATTKVLGPMTMNGSDGWVRGVDAQILFWCPPDAHRELLLLSTTTLLSLCDIALGANISNQELAIGDEWRKCYVDRS